VLSRVPIEKGRKIVLPHESFGTGLIRAATFATIQCGDRPLRIMSVHLPSVIGVSYDERREQVESVLAIAAAVDGPVLIGGDFNASWIGSLFERAGFSWLNKDLPGTLSVLGIGYRVDHVFIRGLTTVADGPAVGLADARGASDHKVVWARLQFSPQPGDDRAPARD
jgi:endonuclease/exonuclease/phosphatase family metal-dependent hydrolase